MFCIIEALMLSLSLCGDTFVAAMSCGARRISVPAPSAFVICGVNSGLLLISCAIGAVLAPLFSASVSRWICFTLLFLMGLIRLFDSALKSWIRRTSGRSALSFTAFRLHFLLEIYADPEIADMDDGGILSVREALFLALPLSIDGMAAGFGVGAGGTSLILTGAFSFLLGLISVFAGAKLGMRLSQKFDISPAGGILLIILALLKLKNQTPFGV